MNHYSSGTYSGQTGAAIWMFDWEAPSSSVVTVKFYSSGLAANGTGSTSGDYTYTFVSTITLGVEPTTPDAGFYASPTSGMGPLSVNFTDTSANIPTGWDWDFGDGGNSSLQNPSHVYPAKSFDTSYSVRLIVSNTLGGDTILKSNYIHVSANTTTPPVLGELPDLKLFKGESLSFAFDLSDFMTQGVATGYSVISNFLDLSTVTGSTVQQASYGLATVGTDYFAANNIIGSGISNNKIKYSA